MRLTIIFSCVLSLFAVSPLRAKCPFASYRVEGRLLLPPDVQPQDIRLYLFLEGAERATDYLQSAQRVDFAIPAADGSFQAEAWLSTIASFSPLRGEKCDRVETVGDLFVVGHGIYAHRVKIKFKESAKNIRQALRASAKLLPIRLESTEHLQDSVPE